jgi:hypothetical protein
MENSVQQLTDDALAARDLVPEQLKPCYLWDGSDRERVRDGVVNVPSIEAPALDQRLAMNRYTLRAGESREGRVLGIRGGLLATDSFVVNLKGFSGHVVTIETTDPFFEDADLHVEARTEEHEQLREHVPTPEEGTA